MTIHYKKLAIFSEFQGYSVFLLLIENGFVNEIGRWGWDTQETKSLNNSAYFMENIIDKYIVVIPAFIKDNVINIKRFVI